MFTGIIQAVGTITAWQNLGQDKRMTVSAPKLDFADMQKGDSIAVNGVCLTVIQFQQDKHTFMADVSVETLTHTSLKQLSQGSLVNLEKALTLSSRLGGHFVSGHVDGIAELVNKTQLSKCVKLDFNAPKTLVKYIAKKGSVCIDGVSLTVNQIQGQLFSLNIVPHTLEQTIIAEYQIGQVVNLEVDMIARYLEKLLLGRTLESAQPQATLSTELLQQHGFIQS